MKTTEFSQPITAANLNESMFKKFGARVNFENYTREELENYRNLLRTKVDQHEKVTGFSELPTNETYQRDKYMLEVLNTKIKEMLGESKKQLSEKAVSKSQQQAAGIALAAKKAGKKATGSAASSAMSKMSTKELEKFASTKHKGLPKKVKEDAKPDFLDVDKDGNKKEPFKKAVKDKGTDMKTTEATSKKAKKDYDGDGKVESEKDEVLGSRMKAAKKAGKMEEGFEDKLDAAREKAAAKGKTKEKEAAKPAAKARTVAGKSYGGSKAKADDTEVDEAACTKAKRTKKIAEARTRAHYTIIIEGLQQFINEDEEGKAKDITAGTDMVNDFTSWMQRVGQYQTKSMIELSDSIRANFGQAESDAFKNTIQPALQEALSSLTQARETITRAVATLAGEGVPAEPMGSLAGEEGDALDLDMAAPDALNAPDEFGASDAAAGGDELSGRGMRESRAFNRAQKLAEAHSIMSKLAR